MQLKIYLWVLLCFVTLNAISQSKIDKGKHKVGDVEIDILSSYYEQEGDHSAVEGGNGTQTLSDKVLSVTLSVPVDSVNIFDMSVSADTYSSASSDHIDGVGSYAVLSTPSSHDLRAYGNLAYSRINRKGKTLTIGAGFSSEFDVKSTSMLLGFAKESEDKNRELSVHVKGYYDKWKLIFPTEYRLNSSSFNLPDVRKTVSSDLSFAQVINKKLQALFSYEFTYQNGLLSTPFHRVYFNDGEDIYTRTGSIEKLPDYRSKHAFGVRISSFPFDWLIGRFYYRYYFDSFGIKAHTLNTEVPLKITRFFSVYPFYRFYSQTAADWFRPYGEHDLSQEFYTSDYDLSNFVSNKIGIGLRLSPPMGLIHLRSNSGNRSSSLKGLELRFAKYYRSDGLRSFIISSNLSFGF
jgi:hypothetical protein